jgi:hypothetical protein
MKEYPSIYKDINNTCAVYGFDKLDGSCIRAEWNKKRGFYKFGSRTQLIDEKTPVFGEAIGLVLNTYADDLSKVFTKKKYQEATCFLEFYGPNSFAGAHLDEPHEVTLFDVSPFKVGILPAADFVELFGHLKIPNICFHEKINQDIIQLIRDSRLEGMTFEGIVCKAGYDKKKHLIRFKIKSNAWLNKLKTYCKGDEDLFKKLE